MNDIKWLDSSNSYPSSLTSHIYRPIQRNYLRFDQKNQQMHIECSVNIYMYVSALNAELKQHLLIDIRTLNLIILIDN